MTDAAGDNALAAALPSLVSDAAAARYIELLAATQSGDAGAHDANASGAGANGDGDDPVIEELVRAGLVGQVSETGIPFVHPPRLALARAAQNATQAWLANAPDFAALTTVLDAVEPATPSSPATSAIPAEVDDRAERQQALEALVIGAMDELSVLQPYEEGMDADDAEGWTSQADAAVAARVTCRTVYDARLFRVANFEAAIHEEVALGAQVRITNTPLPGFLLIADRRAAAYTPAPETPGRITSESSLVAMLHLAFEATWSAATPFWHDQALSDDHLTVLTLVGLGHTNRQIASMLDLNERTIRRRVSDLLDHFGETERATLVRHAHFSPSSS